MLNRNLKIISTLLLVLLILTTQLCIYCTYNHVNDATCLEKYCINDNIDTNRLNAIDLEQRLDDSSFDIEGLGVTAEESQNAIGKWFPWWPYYPTGIWCRANENITLTVTGGALQL